MCAERDPSEGYLRYWVCGLPTLRLQEFYSEDWLVTHVPIGTNFVGGLETETLVKVFDHWTNGLCDTWNSVTKYAIWMFVCSVGPVSCPVVQVLLLTFFFLFQISWKENLCLKVWKVTGQDTSLSSVEQTINTKILFLSWFCSPFCISKIIYKVSHSLK